ncbi:hypothetical protein B0H12DRAFT_805477 [Mycena haematopus]|nr:hypothetical protein B0H12DRAFT_805477 [Mycena haematopus]
MHLDSITRSYPPPSQSRGPRRTHSTITLLGLVLYYEIGSAVSAICPKDICRLHYAASWKRTVALKVDAPFESSYLKEVD